MQLFFRILILLVCAFLITFAHPCYGEEAKRSRVALIIGNGRYESSVGPLKNTINDARAMAKTLRGLGFVVIEKHNVNRDELLTAMLQFQSKLRGAEVALFYFAGHGISVSGSNYLLPVKSGYRPENADETALRLLAETKLFNVEQAVAEMCSANVGCNLLILDACRTTPAARRSGARDAHRSGGLLEMNPPAGSLIAFATDAGHVALDGDGTNGLYTGALISQLLTRGLTIEQVFKRTRAAVMERSNGEQIPAEYSRLIGDDIFLAGQKAEETNEKIPKGQPIPIPSANTLRKLAAAGDAAHCINEVRRYARYHGPGKPTTDPLELLLDGVKESFRNSKTAVARAQRGMETCEFVMAAIPDCVSSSDEKVLALTARAHNRKGDALLLLERPSEALECYNQALALTPEDAYVLYNRGCALLQLRRSEEAAVSFNAAMTTAKDAQPGARKLALKALEGLKP